LWTRPSSELSKRLLIIVSFVNHIFCKLKKCCRIIYQLEEGDFVDEDGNDWNEKEASALIYMLRNLCSSKFTLSSFFRMAKESFDFALTLYQNHLQGIQIVDDVTNDLYGKVIPILQKVI
jgi:uncharacterized protein YnzC (UPF0291/DUF896 family)